MLIVPAPAMDAGCDWPGRVSCVDGDGCRQLGGRDFDPQMPDLLGASFGPSPLARLKHWAGSSGSFPLDFPLVPFSSDLP